VSDAAGTMAPPETAGRRPARQPTRRQAGRLSTPVLVAYAIAIALLAGFGSAYWALKGEYPVGSVRVGPWTTWPKIGSREADPYARAVVARSGEVPLGVGEGLAFVASADSAGRSLDANCVYGLGSVTPQARYWTLTVYDADGRPARTDLGRSGMTSAEILRRDDGSFLIELSRTVRPGNWLQLPSVDAFTLMLRLYDTPVAAGSAALDARVLPRIERLECGP
jgi:hypothetical protein